MFTTKIIKRLKSPLKLSPQIDQSLFDEVVNILNDQPGWDQALNTEKALENAVHSASYYGVMQPFNADEQNLINYLSKHLSGRHIATYAWGVYTDVKAQHTA